MLGALAVLYTFLAPIIAKLQGRRTQISADRREDFGKLKEAMYKELDRRDEVIEDMQKRLDDKYKRITDLEAKLESYFVLEGAVLGAGWVKTASGWTAPVQRPGGVG